MKFVSLHTHNTESHGDGFGTVVEHGQRVHELGMSAVAMTDHRNTNCHVELEMIGQQLGLKTIYGCEFNVTERDAKERRQFHQTVLAMDEEGYRNLNRLVTISYKQSYQWPRIYTDQILDPELTKGLIVLSGCADSWLSCTILGGKAFGDRREDWRQEDIQAGRVLIEQFQEVYDDRYYLECQQFPGLERSTILNQAFMDLSQVTGVKPVVTADVHYPNGDDNEMQRLLHAAHRGGTVTTMDADWEYNILLTYPESDAQVINALKQQQLTDEEANRCLDTTAEIAARCNVELPRSEPVRYKGDKIASTVTESMGFQEIAAETLKEWIEEGIDYRLRTNPAFKKRFEANEQGYIDRILTEFPVIDSKGFCDYFLVTADLVVHAKDIGIGVGPGRGSAAGSLICYLLRITEIDPMQFPLMQFERFIDPSRDDMPDIDIDFQDDRRWEMFQYAADTYGPDYTANIGSKTRYRGKTALNDVGRAYQIPFAPLRKITDLIVDRPDGDPRENDSVSDTIESFEAAQEVVDQYPMLALAARLEGNIRGMGMHAAGLVISNTPISDVCAVYTKTKADGTEASVVSFDKRAAERQGMLKLDMLGLSTMGIIADVVKWTDITWEKLYALPYDDQEVLQRFAAGDLTGIFQFEGRTTRGIVDRIFEGYKPIRKKSGNFVAKGYENPLYFDTLADINALSRPGSLLSGMTKRYEKIAQGKAQPRDYGYEIVNKVLEDTFGCLVYQEQVMAMGREVGGFPGEKVGALRRIIGKKKAGGAFDEFFQAFLDGAVRDHGMAYADAEELWNFMGKSSSYLFNIAHAVSYAVIAYWSMYLKIHYPVEFYAASLKRADKDHTLELLQDAVRHGVTIVPPDIMRSGPSWQPMWVDGKEDLVVMAGFDSIEGIGTKTADVVVQWRDQVGLSTELVWNDLIQVKGIGPKSVEKIVEWVSSDDPFRIYAATRAVDAVWTAIETGEIPLAEPSADAKDMTKLADEQIVWLGMVKDVQIIDVIEAERKRTNEDPEVIRAGLRDPHLHTRAKLICVDKTGVEVHVQINRWLYPELAGDIASITKGHDVVHVVGTVRLDFGHAIGAKAVVVVDPE